MTFKKTEIIKTKGLVQAFSTQQIREYKDKFREFVGEKSSWFLGVGIALNTKTVPYTQNIAVNCLANQASIAETCIDAFVVAETDSLDSQQKLRDLFTLKLLSDTPAIVNK